jgi:hypothetical protein
MTISQVWFGSVCLAAACMSAADEPGLDSMIAKHVGARGGAAAIENVRTFECDLHIVEPTPQWIETTYSDYRPIGGVLYSHQQVERELVTGTLLFTGTIREIRINPPLEPTRFSLP